jgi:hypothetical protein
LKDDNQKKFAAPLGLIIDSGFFLARLCQSLSDVKQKAVAGAEYTVGNWVPNFQVLYEMAL